MKQTVLPLLLLALCTVTAAAADTEPQVVQIPDEPPPPLTNLVWKLPPKYATLEGDRLVIDIPTNAYPSEAVATAKLPAELFAGAEGFSMTVCAEGSALAKPTREWLGLKFQIHWKESATGREGWPNGRNAIGDLPPTVLRNDASYKGAHPDAVTLELGLQGTSGRVVFDLSTLRGGPSTGLFRRINRDWTVRYPDEARRPPLRGCMLPTRDTTEDDIETLHRWGATLARFQICRGWTRRDANQDLEDYAAWVDSRLDNLANVLRWAEARGMKIVLDLHVAPGGRNAKDLEDNMLHNDRFAEAWLDTWRRIATRFKGDPALYGYDLWNEPNQKNRARNDYWTLQRRAAEIVRAIDPDTPIIVESNNSASPSTFSYLSPLRMDNVIYQVHCYTPSTFTHQGINNYENGTKWPDPEKGWDKEYIRKALEPVREFEARHHAKIYVGEFSAIVWAEGAENYLRDCIELFEEYGWDWTYHAFREWSGWSVEHEGSDPKHLVPSEDNPRKRVLLDGFAGRIPPQAPPAPPPAPAAKPAPATATYKVETDSPDAIYPCGATATFAVTVLSTNGVVKPDGTISVSLDNFGPQVFTNAVFDLSATNSFRISGTLREPGFLRLVLPENRGGNAAKNGPHVFSAAFEPGKIRKGSPSPPDFDEFWATARRNLDATVPLDPQLTLLPERSQGAFRFWRVSFATWGGTRVYGYLSIPKDASAEKRYPVRFQVPAAGEGRWTCDMDGSPDEIRMFMTVHTFEPPFDLDELHACYVRLRDELEAKYRSRSYATAGLDVSREDYYFYRAILGIDRAVDWLAAREEVDPERFTYAGTSQGGGFGLVLMGLNHHFTKGALYVPAMTDTMGYLAGRKSGWPNPVFAQPDGSREAREKNAPYFDGANFASRIRCPVRVAVGFSDTTCPPCAVHAAYNEIGVADKAILNGIGMTHNCRYDFYKEMEAWLRKDAVGQPAPPDGAAR